MKLLIACVVVYIAIMIFFPLCLSRIVCCEKLEGAPASQCRYVWDKP